jgi:hypothetical protein
MFLVGCNKVWILQRKGVIDWKNYIKKKLEGKSMLF